MFKVAYNSNSRYYEYIMWEIWEYVLHNEVGMTKVSVWWVSSADIWSKAHHIDHITGKRFARRRFSYFLKHGWMLASVWARAIETIYGMETCRRWLGALLLVVLWSSIRALCQAPQLASWGGNLKLSATLFSSSPSQPTGEFKHLTKRANTVPRHSQ